MAISFSIIGGVSVGIEWTDIQHSKKYNEGIIIDFFILRTVFLWNTN